MPARADRGPTQRHRSIYQAMMLGMRDYVNKTGFPSVVIGLRAASIRR